MFDLKRPCITYLVLTLLTGCVYDNETRDQNPPHASSTRPISKRSDSLSCIKLPNSSVCEDVIALESKHYLPQTLPHEDLELNERNLELILGLVQSQEFPFQCAEMITNLFCIAFYGPCDPTNNLPMQICEKQCQALNTATGSATCNKSLDLLLGIPYEGAADLFYNLNCSEFSTYFWDYTESSNITCFKLFTQSSLDEIYANETTSGPKTSEATSEPETSEATSEPKMNGSVVVIATSSVTSATFIVVVALFIIIAAVCYKVNQKNKNKAKLMKRLPHPLKAIDTSMNINVPSEYVRTPKQKAKHPTFSFVVEDLDIYKQQFKTILVEYANLFLEAIPIGEGAFGKVYKGKCQDKDIAIKTVKNLLSEEEIKSFFSECFVMKDFDHPNVMKLIGVCLDSSDGFPYIILEYMENGSIKDFLKCNRVHENDIETIPKNLSEEILMQMCLDIARGMYYLAGLRFIHRDLAARNCMVNAKLQIKVGDFGLAKDVYMLDYYRMTSTTKLPVKWMPPETLMDKISNEKTDVWSFGVTCWEVFSLGITPYPGVQNNEILDHVMNGNRLCKPKLCPLNMYDLLKKCWILKPEERPVFEWIVREIELRTEEYYVV